MGTKRNNHIVHRRTGNC